MTENQKNSTGGLVVVVTGSSRGIGKGVALAFGAKGATVYVTGRSTKEGDSSLPGTIHETAAAVTAAGGKGYAVRCDHANDDQVRLLFERVATESGRLDILVNNVATVAEDLTKPGPFWEKSIDLAEIINVGLRSQYIASYFAAPLMVKARNGLIANISFYGSVSYFHGAAYGAQKAGIDKMTADMAVDLRPFNVATVSIWPGAVATELALRIAATDPEVAVYMDTAETPQFTGLVIDAIYRDPNRMALTGQTVIGAEIAIKYGFKDINGKQPPSFRSIMGEPRALHSSLLA